MTTGTVMLRVVAFARLRELLGFGEASIGVPDGTTAEGVWAELVTAAPQLDALRASTRFACNGTLIDAATTLREGDELALLPPVGGG